MEACQRGRSGLACEQEERGTWAREGTFGLHGALQDSRVCVQSNLVQSMPSKEGWA